MGETKMNNSASEFYHSTITVEIETGVGNMVNLRLREPGGTKQLSYL